MPRLGPIRTALAALATAVLVQAAAAAERFPGAEWEKTSPAAMGWSAAKLGEARAWSTEIGSTAVMIVRDGRVVDEWGETAAKTNLHSVRKSLLSALIGIAVSEKKIDLAATMKTLGIDDNAPSLTDNEKEATAADLLKARSGVYHPALYETTAMGGAVREPCGGAVRDVSPHASNTPR